jgi:hypothetical protein
MARYDITRRCGHDESVQITGPRNRRDWIIGREKQQLCDACTRAARDDLNTRAAATATVAGWPDPTGSPRQVAWAQSLRVELLTRLADELATNGLVPADLLDAVTALYARVALRQTEASWWINQRDNQYPARTIQRLFTAEDQAELATIAEARERAPNQPSTESQQAEAGEDPPSPQAAIAALRAAGWTVAKIAAEVGVHRCTVYRWATGTRNPNPANATAIRLIATQGTSQ